MAHARLRLAVGVLAGLALLGSSFVILPPTPAGATPLPSGFRETVVLSGLDLPTNVAFAPDGRVFVTEKRGVVKVFDGLGDPTAEVFADLRTNTHNWGDRGMNGLAIDPDFPATPHVYVTYPYDAPPGQTAPVWGEPGADFDTCRNDPGGYCLARGRLSRLVASGNHMATEQVVLEGWCQPSPAHTVDQVGFGPDGYLYVSGGDGAFAQGTDYGQNANPCGDPPRAAGQDLSAPTAEGGTLRAQDLRTSGDPVTLNGTIVRIDKTTGAGAPGNPLAGHSDPNARRILAHGLRNPYRFDFRPGTGELWIGDVGWGSWEEINRIPAPTDGTADNFGWPCYEGAGRQGGWDALDLDICERLYAAGSGAVSAPYFSYRHSAKIVADGDCPAGGEGSITGPVFYPGGNWPDAYDGALFFADYTRNCLLVMRRGSNGLPSPTTLAEFSSLVRTPVDLEIGPGGDLYYVDVEGGTVRRISYAAGDQPPVAAITADRTSGPAPLAVAFDGTGSRDPEGGALTYAWDLDGDGAFDDSTSSRPTRTYGAGTTTVRLRVTDPGGATGTASVAITSGNSPPVPTIATPTATTTWEVGQTIGFSGSATDDQGAIPASGLRWGIDLHHCPEPTSCHTHPLSGFDGVASGSFAAPDHEYFAYLEITLTARDAAGLEATATRRIDPRLANLTLESDPAGMSLQLNAEAAPAPFTRPVLVGSRNSVSAAAQSHGGTPYSFFSWSDGGAASHDVTVRAATTLRATFRPSTSGTPAFDRAYNLGGPALTIDGNAWRAGDDAAVTHDGTLFSNQAVALAPATDAARATMIRSSAYTKAGLDVAVRSVPAGTYDVYVTTWEDNNSVTFDLLVEGTRVGTGLRSGTAGSWARNGPYRVTIGDGKLDVATRGGTSANVSGIELWRVPGGGTPTTTTTTTTPTSTTTTSTTTTTTTPPGGRTITVADKRRTEPDSGTVNLVFNVRLSSASTSTVRVSWRTTNGTATAPSDYTAGSGTLSFSPGQTVKYVTVKANGDTVREPDETFTFDLSAPSGATLGDARAVGTIVDDD